MYVSRSENQLFVDSLATTMMETKRSHTRKVSTIKGLPMDQKVFDMLMLINFENHACERSCEHRCY